MGSTPIGRAIYFKYLSIQSALYFSLGIPLGFRWRHLSLPLAEAFNKKEHPSMKEGDPGYDFERQRKSINYTSRPVSEEEEHKRSEAMTEFNRKTGKVTKLGNTLL